ncbi:MAG: type II toxin-antitoxin system CcdA family antitoxin [Gammaproteobacteria bacterium]|nr:type II toxin-antitoxin system CcdA family antitoxin [Gammaproteobacteria bacterium]MDH5801461.1 type II toxin-antitoxin system CcdA family antitoxin [Gammaproteobacteria bacterium]
MSTQSNDNNKPKHKKWVHIRINKDLALKAKNLKIDLSKILEAHLGEVINAQEFQDWDARKERTIADLDGRFGGFNRGLRKI